MSGGYATCVVCQSPIQDPSDATVVDDTESVPNPYQDDPGSVAYAHVDCSE